MSKIADQKMNTHINPKVLFVLRSACGKYATYDTASGPSLTGNHNNCYVWEESKEAESQRDLYSLALGIPLSVEPYPSTFSTSKAKS